jgi:uncharacterized repeat protein (TIGR03806 family)
VSCFARIVFVWLMLTSIASAATSGTNQFGLTNRIPFTGSKLVGSPDPPLPYRARRAFPELNFKHPLHITHVPDADTMLVIEQAERVLAFTNQPSASTTNIFCFIRDHEIYSVTFHPGFATNRFAYVFSNGPQSSEHKTNKIYRYTVPRNTNACDDTSRTLIIEWESNGHNGGDMAFGPDGMFYASAGDGTSDSDRNLTGQDLSDLNGGIIRIDVEHPSTHQAYAIPSDNPFLQIPGARGELWCYGMRNPWRIHFDPEGHLWVGDIGQDVWEMIIIAQRGANYGWSVTEGGHPFHLQRKRGPTPITAPTIELHHSEARSITGGIVYRGKKLPNLRGAYVFGDYGTGRIWAARVRDGKIVANDLIADTPHQMLGFGEDAQGEMFYVDYAGAVYELEPIPATETTGTFPRRLSDTGLFDSTKDHSFAPGIVSYSVNAPYWADGARAQRFMALPGTTQIEFVENDTWKFPEGTVLAQTLTLDLDAEIATTRKRIETRVLLFQQNEWAAYTYVWNDEQTDAVLVDSGADEREFVIKDSSAPGGKRSLTWQIPSRADCLTCHSRQAGFALGLNTLQMNRGHSYERNSASIFANQITTLAGMGALKIDRRKHRDLHPAALPSLTNPYDSTAPLTNRLRAYLYANCSHCHTEAGGGNSAMELRTKSKLEEMRIIDVHPQHDTFEFPDARIIAPGYPERSVMFRRLSQRGFGQMPPLSITTVDERAVRMFEEWIRSLKPD